MALSSTVIDGTRKFIRLTALRSDPLQTKWVRDEFDLIEAYDVVGIYFHETKPMLGKRMYKGQDFDPVEDVKRNVEEYLLGAREQKDIPAQRKRNLGMYHLVVEPVIDLFKGMEHAKVLKTVDKTLAEAKDLLLTMDVDSHYDDAIVAREQVRKMIREREERRKLELYRKRKMRRRRKKDLSDLIPKEDSLESDLKF